MIVLVVVLMEREKKIQMNKEKFCLLSLYLLDIIIAICFIINVLYGNISLDILTRFIATYCAIELFIECFIFEFIFDIYSQYKRKKKND